MSSLRINPTRQSVRMSFFDALSGDMTMKKLRTLGLAFATLALSTGLAVAQGWSVAIEQNPALTNCGNTTNIPVAGASDCTTATSAAWSLLTTLLQTPNCMGPACPAGSTIDLGVSSCTPDPYTRPNGSQAIRWQVSWTWNCLSLPLLPCCQCLGSNVTLDLSTGKGVPIDPLWKVNGGPAYTTPPVPGWLTTLTPAKWIQPVASPTPSSNVPVGFYRYTTQFDVPMCTIPSDVQLDGKFAADNSAIVRLDGNQIAACLPNTCFKTPAAPVPFSVAAILPGTHTLTIDVKNDGGPSGLVVNAQLNGKCKKP